MFSGWKWGEESSIYLCLHHNHSGITVEIFPLHLEQTGTTDLGQHPPRLCWGREPLTLWWPHDVTAVMQGNGDSLLQWCRVLSWPRQGALPCISPMRLLSSNWTLLCLKIFENLPAFFFFFPPLKTQVAIDHPDWVTQYVMPRNPAVIFRWAYMWCMFKGSKACMEETPSLLCRCTQKKRERDVWSICLAPGGLSVCRLGVLWGSPRACGECKRLSSTITLLLASSEHRGPQGLLNSVVQVAKGLCHHYSALFCFLWATKPLPMALPRTQCCQCSFQKAMQQASTRSENHRIQYWITES